MQNNFAKRIGLANLLSVQFWISTLLVAHGAAMALASCACSSVFRLGITLKHEQLLLAGWLIEALLARSHSSPGLLCCSERP